MHLINEVFDKVYLVNLEQDTSKYQIMKEKLDNLNIKFELFKAIDGNKLNNIKLLRYGNKGAVGCKMSHMEIIKNAKINNYSKILILEDDLYFWKNFNERFNYLYQELMEKDETWNVLYFGACNRNTINKNSESIHHIGSKFIACSCAIGLDKSIYDTILKSENDNRPYDDIVGEDIKEKNYIFFPYLIYQNINKKSNTVNNNHRNQKKFNQNNFINTDKYF